LKALFSVKIHPLLMSLERGLGDCEVWTGEIPTNRKALR